jgi:hypothetical protein
VSTPVNVWPQTGSFDTSNYTSDYNPLVNFPTSLQLPDTAAELAEFVANIGEEIVDGILADFGINVTELQTDLTNIESSLATLFGDIATDPGDIPAALGSLLQNIVTFFSDIAEPITADLANLLGVGTLAQTILDVFVDFLGGSGTGNVVGTLENLISNIPLIGPLAEELGGPANATLAQLAAAIQSGTNELQSAIFAALGGSGSPANDAIQTLLGDLAGVVSTVEGDVGSLLSDGTAALGGSGNSVASFVAGLENINPSTIEGDIAGAIGTATNGITVAGNTALEDITGFLQAFPALNITGQLRSAVMQLVPGAHIVASNPQLLNDPGFDSSATVSTTSSRITWDGTVGNTALGSLKIMPDGLALYSEVSNPIPAAAGQQFSVSIFSMWSGLEYTGTTPIQLQVLQFFQGARVASTEVAQFTSPAATESTFQQLTGGFTVPSGVDTIYLRPCVTQFATGGSVWFDDASVTNVSTIPNSVLGTIDNSIVSGIQGVESIGATIQGTWDNFATTLAAVFGFSGVADSGNSLSTVTGVIQGTGQTANNAMSLGQTNSTTLANAAVSKPTFQSIDPTADSVFNITSLTGTDATTVPVTSSASAIGVIGTPNGGVKETIIFLGQNTSGITSIILNVYSVSTSNGAYTLVFSTPNVVANVLNTLSWNYIDIPTADFITTAQGDWFAVEMQIQGTGTYDLVGIPGHFLPANPNVFPAQLGATRDTFETVIFDAVGAGADVNNQTTSDITITWSHTATAGGDVFVSAFASQNSEDGISSITATYGGVAMTLLATAEPSGTNFGLQAMFHLANVPGGAKTVNVTAIAATGPVTALVGDSVSYLNVGSVGGTAATTDGTSTALSQTGLTGVSQGITVQAFAGFTTSGAASISAYSATQRFLHNASAGTDVALLMGDSAATGSLGFTATSSVNIAYSAIAVVLSPAAAPAPATITSPTGSQNVPWFGLGGSTVPVTIAPQTTLFNTAGEFTYDVPEFAKFLDVIVLGGGSSGTSLSTEGAVGGNSTATVGSTTLTGAGGAGGIEGSPNGASPGNVTFDGVTYFGGTAVGPGSNGSAPGGGGGGFDDTFFAGAGGAPGSFATPTTFSSPLPETVTGVVGAGGDSGESTGAPGSVWIVARQS